MTIHVQSMLRAALVSTALILPFASAFAYDPAGAAGPSYTDQTPGWTGRTIILGSHSRIADDAVSTRERQTGQY